MEEIPDEVALYALESTKAGCVWHHFLVRAGDPAFFCGVGCKVSESTLQCLKRLELITRAPVSHEPADNPGGEHGFPFGIPVVLTPAGEEWLAAHRALILSD